MEKPGKIEVTRAQAEQLVKHLQQYVRAALIKKNDPDALPPKRECEYCMMAGGDCNVCPLDVNRNNGIFCTDAEQDGYILSNWMGVDKASNIVVERDYKQILARARVLQERTNKWIYPWQIEDLSRVVKKEEGK